MSTFDPQKLEALRASFKENGITVQGFVDEHRLSYGACMAVLKGRSNGTRGEGYKAAVALGLRRAPTKKRSRATATPVSTSAT